MSNNNEDGMLVAAGLALVAGAAWLLFGRDDASGTTLRARVTDTVQDVTSSGGIDAGEVAASIPNPFEADYAGMLDGLVGSFDEDVGGAIQDAADTLGSGPGDLLDSLASESTAQSAIRTMFPSVAVAETATSAGSDLMDTVTSGSTDEQTQDEVTDSWADQGLVDDTSTSDSGSTGDPWSGDSSNVDDSEDWADDVDQDLENDYSGNRDAGESTEDYADRLGF